MTMNAVGIEVLAEWRYYIYSLVLTCVIGLLLIISYNLINKKPSHKIPNTKK